MPYKKYIKRDGKTYGPYIYHSRKEGGRVITEYHGKLETEKKYLPVGIFLVVLLIFSFGFTVFNFGDVSFGAITGFTALDDSENIENILLEPVDPLAIIRFVIEIISAEHLDENREFISDIYEQTKELDGIWSGEINDGEFVRVTFEQNLTNENDITIYLRIISPGDDSLKDDTAVPSGEPSGNPRIEIYEFQGTEIIAVFENIVSNQYNKILLTDLVGKQDTFDLRILNGSVDLEVIFE